jgi:calpain-15
LFIQGKPKIVKIDDYFPCHSNKTFAFSYSGPGEIWVQVLEKAWAKINQSYINTIGGFPSEALSALSSAPMFSYHHNKFKDTNKLWKLLKESDYLDFIICSNSINSAEAETVGIFPSQSYAVVSVKEYKNIRLLKMMNPWGAYEWKVDFSEGSLFWTNKLKKEMGYVNSNEGMFFIKFEDFLKYFEVTYICKYYTGYYYDFKKFIQNPTESMVCAKFNITKPCRVVLGMHQKQTRFYRKVFNYSPQSGRIILARYRNDTYKYVCSSFSDEEKIFLEIDKLGK